MTNDQLYAAARVAVVDCMGLKPGEKVLIVADEPEWSVALALHRVVRELGNELLLVEILPRKSNGEEPPAEVAALMKEMDVVLCPTSKSLTHTDARREASARGVRVGTLPGITEEIMVRCLSADYHRIARRTNALCALMDRAEQIRVRAPGGTDITLPKKGRKAFASTGLFTEKGQWGNLPTGESFLAPLEGESNGVVVVDGSMATIGIAHVPIRIEVRHGYAEEITGGREAERFIELLAPHGRDGRNVAEFGIGTNDKAVISGIILEDEKVMGTIHIAFGDNKSMGGTVRVASHLDGLVKRPTVWFDETCIMKDGVFAIDLDTNAV
jgi:leucyl aminopeptidase (aminopeptidase T)